jgi:transcription antitermination factor NusG
VLSLIMAGDGPGHVPDDVIAELRSRERDGLVELPEPRGLQPGDRVRIVSGVFRERLALNAGQTAHERVAVLLQFLGGQQPTEVPADAIEPGEVVP